VRLSYAIELVVVAAVGLALARWHLLDPMVSHLFDESPWWLWSRSAAECFLTGAASVGGLGAWVERMLRRSPRSRGPSWPTPNVTSSPESFPGRKSLLRRFAEEHGFRRVSACRACHLTMGLDANPQSAGDRAP
jgi:hypothetical protein